MSNSSQPVVSRKHMNPIILFSLEIHDYRTIIVIKKKKKSSNIFQFSSNGFIIQTKNLELYGAHQQERKLLLLCIMNLLATSFFPSP